MKYKNVRKPGWIALTSLLLAGATVLAAEDGKAKAQGDAAAELPAGTLPEGVAAVADFTVSPGKVKPDLHCASWVTRSYPRGFDNDDAKIKPLKLTAFRTHDAPLVNSGQRIVDTQYIFPLMHLDAKDPKNYVFEPTDHYLKLNLDLGMKCFYRMGTSIEHTGTWGFNTLNPPDHQKYAEALAGIVRHYTKGWANGYTWGEKMKYWELFNEPDIKPCWRGTKEEFIDLFVTCLKRLKSEFPELKIGGPAFGSVNKPYMNDLLAACKAAGVSPDFISWHFYGSDPRRLLAQPAQVREICTAAGFPDVELILNEWHYLRNNSWDGIQGSSSPAAMKRALEGAAGVTGIDSAVFTLQVETGFHDTPLAQSYFYGCGYDDCWGYVDRYRQFNKVYYAVRAMGELVADCADRAACRTSVQTLGAFAAWTKDRRGAELLVSDYCGKGQELAIDVKGLPADAKVAVRVLDETRDLVPTEAFTWQGGRLVLRKSAPGSAVFQIRFDKPEPLAPDP